MNKITIFIIEIIFVTIFYLLLITNKTISFLLNTIGDLNINIHNFLFKKFRYTSNLIITWTDKFTEEM